MATKYAEGVLAVKYRVVGEDGHSLGGPFYYIEKGMGKNWRWLAKAFALFGVLAGLLGIGTITQVNGIVNSLRNFFDPQNQKMVSLPVIGDYSIAVVIGAVLVTACVALVLIGGIKRISNVADIMNGLMAIPNMIALFALSGVVTKETKDFFRRRKEELKK